MIFTAWGGKQTLGPPIKKVVENPKGPEITEDEPVGEPKDLVVKEKETTQNTTPMTRPPPPFPQ